MNLKPVLSLYHDLQLLSSKQNSQWKSSEGFSATFQKRVLFFEYILNKSANDIILYANSTINNNSTNCPDIWYISNFFVLGDHTAFNNEELENKLEETFNLPTKVLMADITEQKQLGLGYGYIRLRQLKQSQEGTEEYTKWILIPSSTSTLYYSTVLTRLLPFQMDKFQTLQNLSKKWEFKVEEQPSPVTTLIGQFSILL